MTIMPQSWQRLRPRPAWVAVVAVALLLTGCSSFHGQWKKAAAAPATGLEGAWEGTWLSHSNAHTGRLRAVVTRTAGGDYETRFHATFWRLFSAGYTVTLRATPQDGGWTLAGREDLGRWLFWNFGEYEYTGEATPERFDCTYRSQNDHGVFQLKRPVPRQ
jgi:hypothetical protein